MNQGAFFVIEGIDGSGKGTQTKMLFSRLKKMRALVKMISFPQYNTPSAHFVEKYLRGEYGDAVNMDPRLSSVFYAADRFDGSFTIQKWLKQGAVVIADRYLASNLGHQGSKIKDLRARKKFMQWVYDFEYNLLGIPKPNINIFLDVPPRIASRFIDMKADRSHLRGKKRDMHEGSLSHLKRAHSTYHTAVSLYPKDFIVVDCAPRGRLMSLTEIHEKIFSIITKQLHL
ncbi:MAG: hypothetical protein COU08_01480 [Candidatus Harrisonbacteria bacterium CG10_big_fil_rev_8_21_14_0_10_42_17]|uniref:Thymidylate kinase n=1 Tax=Candidatus Harrisonbacteria bacterium CG10_big_fil_rev_8_21_14_0_10_42_17 TaxID=1974584 RepID=A0A2M6WIQ7_9BACT|nr:MAG: hypothetical protein COU08_01480 [Candidatus Harrisonbacteria bacterium CG10_big_fil_rev_8_21_14_0_10_42_17]